MATRKRLFSKETLNKEGINIFNIGVGVASPVIGMIRGERDKYQGITDKMFQYYRDDFMVASG